MSLFVCFVDGPCKAGRDFCHITKRMCQQCSDYLNLCFTGSHIPNCTAVCKESLKEQLLEGLREQECSTPPVVLNAVHNGTNGSVPYGETVEYNCSSGYSLLGGGTLTCGGFGEWSGSVPFCNPIDADGSCIPYYVIWPVMALVMLLLIIAVNKERIIKACKRIGRKPQNNRAPNHRDGEAGLGLLPQNAQDPVQQPGPQAAQQPVVPQPAPQAAQPAMRMTTDAASQTSEIPEPDPADGDIGQADPDPTGGGGDNEQTKAMTVYEPRNDQNRSWNGSTPSMGISRMSSDIPFMVQETSVLNANLGDKQHGWEQSEGATANGHCGMQNGHVRSMEPDFHGHDTEAHGRKHCMKKRV